MNMELQQLSIVRVHMERNYSYIMHVCITISENTIQVMVHVFTVAFRFTPCSEVQRYGLLRE